MSQKRFQIDVKCQYFGNFTEKNNLKPDIICVTDWSKAALDFFLGLIKSGLSTEEAKKKALGLFGFANKTTKNSNLKEFLAYNFNERELESIRNSFTMFSENEKVKPKRRIEPV